MKVFLVGPTSTANSLLAWGAPKRSEKATSKQDGGRPEDPEQKTQKRSIGRDAAEYLIERLKV